MLIENLQRRAKILRAIRDFFDTRDFTEVTTAVRIAAPAPEPYIDCPVVIGKSSCGGGCSSPPYVHADSDPRTAEIFSPPLSDANGFRVHEGRERVPYRSVSGPSDSVASSLTFLRASPELQMKKLLAAGMDRIYQIGPCFREGELGKRHNPEFTMIEWYRRHATYLDIMEDTKQLINSLHCSTFNLPWRAGAFRRRQPLTFSVLTVREAYLKFAGWDPWKDWDQDRFDFDMATKIEPNLPQGPVFLIDYPPQASSLAKIRGTVAERWEFYWHGMELANCFTELCDEAEQRARFAAAKAERQTLGESDYPIDEEFLASLPLIGSASGVALGVDRLVAILCDVPDIHSVMA